MFLKMKSIQPYKFRIQFIIFLNYQLFIIKKNAQQFIYVLTQTTTNYFKLGSLVLMSSPKVPTLIDMDKFERTSLQNHLRFPIFFFTET